jgi:hypothetical protein
MRNWGVLTDLDFEALSCDLLASKFAVEVERFASGADGGVDLRWRLPDGGVGIGQCKHYARSSFAQLMAALRSEVPKVATANPARYLVLTSFDLGVTQKDTIYKLFAQWMEGVDDVYGGADVDQLVSRHPSVERRHLKLWLSTGSQLFWSNHSELLNRSEALRDRLQRTLRSYVSSSAFDRALEILDTHKVCLIAGEPGVGKTVLGRMLVAEAIAQGFEPLEVSADIKEAWTALDADRLQVFLYDDFLGQISFSERMGKNEDARLSDLIDKIASMKTKRLIMTTREYILRDARRDYRQLRDLDARLHFVLSIGAYSRANKAQILYNHLWQAQVAPTCLGELTGGGWARLVDHPHYSPRLIEYCTGSSFDLASAGYLERFVATLDHPEEIWRAAYDRHLNDEQRALLAVLASLPTEVDLEDLRNAHSGFCRLVGIATSARSFRGAVELAEGTFISIGRRGPSPTVSFHSPSVAEFMLDRLIEDPDLLAKLVVAATFFEQLRNLRLAKSQGLTLGRAGGRAEGLPLDGIRAEFVSSVERTFDNPTPDRLLDQTSYVTGYEAPHGYLESRLIFLWNMPVDWRPTDEWLEARLLFVAKRWSEGVGDKEAALELLREVDPGCLSEAALSEAWDALHGWLSSDVDSTSDWDILLRYTDEEEGRPYRADLAPEFESHALAELDAWDPSPPDLDHLIEHASGFGLRELEDALRQKAEEDDNREQTADGRLNSSSRASQVVRVEEASDELLEAMFLRLSKAASPQIDGK